ncbi:hypothetical protein [Tenacibaculum sp. UWU-22]|uniref:hypothetical protein n=1 Tax=Tenacibaculum sp. UWU-22 TaxID=3234187 RepID=UPI0034DAF95D
MKQILLIVFFFFSIKGFTQNVDSPKNAKPGKCYVRFDASKFDYNKVFKEKLWSEVSCDKAKELKKLNTTQKNKESVEALKKYQEALQQLGYEVEVSGLVDDQFVKAHNQYLKEQKKENQKRRKILDQL